MQVKKKIQSKFHLNLGYFFCGKTFGAAYSYAKPQERFK